MRFVRYLITGGSGYIGGRLIERLVPRDETELIVDFDLRAPENAPGNVEFVRGDVRDRIAVRELLERHEIDALIHLAFLLEPIRDEAKMYDIDVNGTHAVLWAASEAGTQHVVVASSASAYGAWPDNPIPIAEDWPVRGVPDFSYPRDKAECDRVAQLWAAEHPDRTMTILRPTFVFGPHVDNYLVGTWLDSPFMPIFDGRDVPFNTVHEDDLVDGIILLLDANEGGAFNFAADGMLTWRESAEMIGMKVRDSNFDRLKRIYDVAWKLHAPRIHASGASLKMARWPWAASNEKLKAAVGWQPKHDTRETFELTMRIKGKLPASSTPATGARAGA